jgi:WD40 repeat protein
LFITVLCASSLPQVAHAATFDFPQGVIALKPERTLMALAPIEIVDGRTRNSRDIQLYDLSSKQMLRTGTLGAVKGMTSAGIEDMDWMGDKLLVEDGFIVYVIDVNTFEVLDQQTLPGINQVRWSPDADHYVLAGTSLSILSLSNAAPVTLESRGTTQAAPSAISKVSWSPDGQYLALGGLDGLITIWNIDGSFVQELDGRVAEGAPTFNVMAWSPDSQQFGYVLVSDTSTIGAYDVFADKSSQLTIPDFRDVSGLTWSADSKKLAYNTTDSMVGVWDVAADELQMVLAGKALHKYRNNVLWSPDGTRMVAALAYNIRVWDTANWDVMLDDFGYPLAWLGNDRLLISVFTTTANGYNILKVP